MSHLNVNQKLLILKLKDSCSKSSLAKKIGCHRSTIYKIISKCNDENAEEIEISKNRRNKSTVYSKQDEINVLSFFRTFPFSFFKDCKIHLNLNFSINTIRTILSKNQISCHVSKIKPFLSPSNQVLR